MNPEALEAAYKLFVDTGYNGTSDDFSSLINSNKEALNASFNQFTETGYNGTEEDFKVLLGVSVETTKPKKEEVVKTDDVELVGEVVPIKEKEEQSFTPNPEGEAYYERLKARDGMMNAEVAAYENWKTENKSKIKEVEDVEVDPLTNQPLVDFSEGVELDYGLKINEDNPLFDKEISESFVYTPENKEISELIEKSDSINKNKNIDPNSIEYYYGDRFTREMGYGDGDVKNKIV